MREIRIRAVVAPVRAAELGMVVYFTNDRLYRRKKYGSTDLTLQFSGIRVDEQSGPVRHGSLLPDSLPVFNAVLPAGTSLSPVWSSRIVPEDMIQSLPDDYE